jgi:hypothetical protein
VLCNGAHWHTARPNDSQRPRSMLLAMYTRPCIIPQECMRAQLAAIQAVEEPSPAVHQLLGGKTYQPRDVHNY